MKALIEKLEAATEGSRELDADIHYDLLGLHVPVDDVPHYTTSIDAALTLHDDPQTAMVDAVVQADNAEVENKNFIWHLIRELCIAALKARK